MKKRCGFVSNSSSSSFFLYGIRMETSDLASALGIENEDAGNYEIYEDVYQRAKKVGLECEGDYDNETASIGLTPTKMDELETMADFKARIKNNIKNMFGKDKQDELDADVEQSFGWHEECWRDG